MNMALIEGNWKQFKGNIRLQWGRLCGNPLDVIIGKREMLAGKIQGICDLAKDGTGKQI